MVWEQRYAVGHRRQIIIIWLAFNWLSMKYFAMLRGSDCFTQWKIQCLNCASVLGNKNVMTYKYQRPLLKRTIVVGEILIPMSLQDFCFPLKINIGTCVKQTFWRYCMFKERVSEQMAGNECFGILFNSDPFSMIFKSTSFYTKFWTWSERGVETLKCLH